MKAYVIGIAGASCSGKTRLAEAIADRLPGTGTVIIPVDSYYRDLSHMPFDERKQYNFDIPGAIDFELLNNHLLRLLDGTEIAIPFYRFDIHARAPVDEWRRCVLAGAGETGPVVIVEGLHTFHDEKIREMIDCRIFIEVSEEICLARRIERDTRERGRTRESVEEQFERTVIRMYETYVLPMREFADIVIDGEKPTEISAETVLAFIHPKL